MSYDISLSIDTGGSELAEVIDVGNITYNISPMIRAACGETFSEMNGRKAADVLSQLRKGLVDMQDNPSKYKAMNPANGWGSYEGTRDFLARLIEHCAANPKCTIEVN